MTGDKIGGGRLVLAAWLAVGAFALPAHAQQAAGSLAYGDADAGDDGAAGGETKPTRSPRTGAHDAHSGIAGYGSGRRTKIRPYLEVDQDLFAQLDPVNTLVTYTTLAAGADIDFGGRRTDGAVSVRYEHRFVEKGRTGSSDAISGLARVRREVVPRTLSIEAGGLAARTVVTAGGGTLLNSLATSGSTSQLWSVYAGPQLTTHLGRAAVNGGYTLGYTEIGALHSVTPIGGSGQALDVFDHSLTQQGSLSASFRPGEILPVGIGANAGYLREDISNLDQRLIDWRFGLQATLPVSRSVALVGDLGWERVQAAQRDALRDGTGKPVIGANGRYVTDKSQPRKIAYQTEGLIWDVGVLWRPSRRTSAAVYVGRRYDSLTYYGSLNYTPNARSSLNVSVYDGISGYGSSINNAVQSLPTDFEVSRNPFSGDIGGCAVGSSGGGCVNGALGSASSAFFRGRGVNLAWGARIGHLRAMLGAGYSYRRYIAAAGTVLAGANGSVDETYYVSAGLSGPIDRRSSFGVTGFAGIYHNARADVGDTTNWGVTGSLSRQITERLVGNASLGLFGVERRFSPDELDALARIGLRYNFR